MAYRSLADPAMASSKTGQLWEMLGYNEGRTNELGNGGGGVGG